MEPTELQVITTSNNLFGLVGTTEVKTAKANLLDQGKTGLVEVGFFKVDDETGSVGGSSRDDADYANKALADATSIVSTLGDNDIQLALSRLVSLQGEHLYGFYVVENGTRDGFLAGDGMASLKFGSDFTDAEGGSLLRYSFLEEEGTYVLNWDFE
jgi:hypothetical protein